MILILQLQQACESAGKISIHINRATAFIRDTEVELIEEALSVYRTIDRTRRGRRRRTSGARESRQPLGRLDWAIFVNKGKVAGLRRA
jgi:hypothetical protein